MPEFHVFWKAEGVETLDASSWDEAVNRVDCMLSDHLAGLTLVDSPDLEPRERAA